MVIIKLSSVFAACAGDRKRIEVDLDEGALLGALLDLVAAKHPGLSQTAGIGRGTIPDHINIFHNGENVRYLQGLKTPLKDGDTVQIIPAEAAG